MEKGYFASCNSFDGFKSYFDRIFDSRNFDRIFVLKGGPGTGKSTLMKRLVKAFSKDSVNVEEFYCSSDINSLDGVIIENDEKRVAILDGTAPHERDAIVVGAIDEIVNLGANLDYTWLEKYRDNILELSGQKSDAYKTAYSYLKCAEACNHEITKTIRSIFKHNSALDFIRGFDFLDGYNQKNEETVRLISSFSKDGYQKKIALKKDSTKAVKIGGNTHAARILLNQINSYFPGKKTLFPYPLDTYFLDALYYEDSDVLFIIDDNNPDINTDDFLLANALTNEKMRLMIQVQNELLLEAKRWFGIASDFHFRLEEIYSRCMDFKKNNEIFDKICEKISKVCDIQL